MARKNLFSDENDKLRHSIHIRHRETAEHIAEEEAKLRDEMPKRLEADRLAREEFLKTIPKPEGK